MTIISVNECFISPNGEGITAGLITLFIRIAGCNFAVEGLDNVYDVCYDKCSE